MSDLIRRQDMLKICDKYNGQGWVWSMIRKEVEELPCDGCCTAHSGYEAGMNREEAIKILKEHHDHWMRLLKEGICTEEEGENTIEALEMAIKALEQEPCNVFDEYGNYKYPSDVELTEPNTATSMPCEDAISRQAAIDVIERWLGCSDYNDAERHIMRATQSVLYDLPSVNPQKNIVNNGIMNITL